MSVLLLCVWLRRERWRPALAGGLRYGIVYQLTETGRCTLGALGVALPADSTVHCCIDWTEQRHHVAGRIGRALLDTLTTAGWIRAADRSRALITTEAGKRGLRDHLGLSWPPPAANAVQGVSAVQSDHSRPAR